MLTIFLRFDNNTALTFYSRIFALLCCVWEIVVENGAGRNQPAQAMQAFVIFSASPFLVQINAWIVAKDCDIHAALEQGQE